MVLSPGVAAFIGFVAQAMFVLSQSARASVLHELVFSFNKGDATGTQEIGV